MIIIQEILVSDDVVEKKFLCNLNACKGACCWEGDFGAPLEKEEKEKLAEIYEDVKPFLMPVGIDAIEEKGLYTWFEEPKEFGTTLLENGACAYLTFENGGIAKCGIEKAYEAGKVDFKKPISCHLYPLRINKDENTDFEAINYDKWDICSPACKLGEKEQLPAYKFVKEAIIRKYGVDFYEELDAAAQYLREEANNNSQ